MLHLLLGTAKTGKTTELLRRIAQQGEKRRQILIVPEQYSHETERRLCRQAGNRSAAYCEVLSFTRLCSRVFAETGGGQQTFLDGGGRLLLMHEAVQAVSGQLSVYAKPSKKAAFLENLLATSDELKSYCVTPEQILSAGQGEDSPDGQRLRDLGLILGAYDALVEQRSPDPRDRLTRMTEALDRCSYGRGWDFYLDCFTDFTPQQLMVLEKLMKRGHSVTVALTVDTLDAGGSDTRSFYRRTALRLLELARSAHMSADYETLTRRRDGAPAELTALEEGLFRQSEAVSEQEPAALRIVSAATPYDEVEFAAGELVRLAREEGYRWREMAVAFRTAEGYGDLVETIFERYGIPVFMGKMEDILQKPVLTLLTAALETVQGNYEYEDLFRYLKTGLAGVSLEEVDLLENYALRWDIRGRRWTQEESWSWHPEGYGLKWTKELREQVKGLDKLRRRIVRPLERLRQTPEGPGLELVQALYAFLEEIDLPRRLTDRAEALRQRGELQQAEEYRQLWDILCGAMEQCAQLMGDSPMTMEDFAGLFRLVLSQYDVGTIPVALDRVSVGELQRMTHKEAKVLFLLGVDDAHFPMVTQNPGLLTDEDREFLRGLGCELSPGADQMLDRETATACDGVCLPSERLYLSWARQSGGECRPATLITAAQRLFPALVIREPEQSLRFGAPLPALDAAAREGRRDVFAALKENPEWAERITRMAAAKALTRGHLSRPVVDALYGKKVRLSASRMDTMKSCHFAYFMQYGLKAKARKTAQLDPPQIGVFVHYVLEHVLRDAKELGGVKRLSEEQIRTLARTAVEQYLKEELGDLEAQPPRFRYLFRRLLKSMDLIVNNVTEELRRSDFEPISFELGFGEGQTLPPVELKTEGVTLSISGFVDRVDGWEKDGRLYLRVVDYKTGKKSFSLTDVWHGLELQMLLYLFTLEDKGKALYGKDVVASGVLYLPARDLILPGSHGMTEEQRQKEADKALRRSGMMLSDPEVLDAMEHLEGTTGRFLNLKVSKRTGDITGEVLATAEQWGIMRRHVGNILRDIARETAAGDVTADPFLRSSGQSYCDWCDYQQCCHFEEGQGGDCRRFLYSVKDKTFWNVGDR